MKSRVLCLCVGAFLLAGLGCGSGDKKMVDKPGEVIKPKVMPKPPPPPPAPTPGS